MTVPINDAVDLIQKHLKVYDLPKDDEQQVTKLFIRQFLCLSCERECEDADMHHLYICMGLRADMKVCAELWHIRDILQMLTMQQRIIYPAYYVDVERRIISLVGDCDD